jgi:two-component system, cell cycle sensor histidine kinase and response regulator CckA
MKKSGLAEPGAGNEILRHVPEFSSLHFKELLESLRETIGEWLGEKAPRFGASLASYTLLSLALRLQSLPTLMRQHGVASTFEAEFISREIGNLFRDATLAGMTAKSSYYGLDRAWGSYDLMVSSERSLWMAWSISALSVALAVVLWLAGTLRQRKREEVLLRESEGRFRAIFGQAGVGVAQISLKGKVELANDRYCEVVGHTREDLLDKGTLEITHREDLKEQLTKLPRLLAGEIQSFSTEKRYQRKDGTIIWATMCKSLVRDGNGRPKCLIAVVEDITARKQAEAALRESEERFRNMADTVPVMIWVAGPDKRFTFLNKTWLDFTGRAMEQELGDGWVAGVHPEDRDRCYESYCLSFEARQKFLLERRLRRADGEYRLVLCSGVPRFERGVFSGYIGSDIDITDFRRAQEEVFDRQKLESLGVLTGGIAHDFNNLLGGILASTELVLAELTEGSLPDAEELRRIRTASIRGGEIVRQLMIYCGEKTQAFGLVDISRLVGEMLQLLKVLISKRAILKVNLPEKLPTLRANAAQMRQVVMNLITNASEALGEKEGVISVSVAQVRSWPDSSAPNPPERDYLRLEVSDTGCGMTEEIQAKIFDPFFTTKFAGRGLGLAALQGIIRSHGGTINVVSAPGQGSCFQILLPCSSESERDGSDMAVSAVAGEVASLARTVLVVEDEDALRVAVSKMLRKTDFSVIEADNGKTAVDLFRASAQQIDVVLLDMTLPGMSGREVFEELRRIQPNVRVIITTAYSQDYALATIGRQQPWLYIRKPYVLSELMALLRSVCLVQNE